MRTNEKPADLTIDGLSDVVEVRRLELLTPYMRSKKRRAAYLARKRKNALR